MQRGRTTVLHMMPTGAAGHALLGVAVAVMDSVQSECGHGGAGRLWSWTGAVWTLGLHREQHLPIRALCPRLYPPSRQH